VAKLLADMTLIAQENFVIVGHAVERPPLVIKLDVIKPDPVPLRVGVGLAHRVGLIACVAETLRHGGQMRLHRAVGLERAVAVLFGRAAGHQGAPRGQADGRFRVAVREPHAIPAQLVQHRRVDRRVPRRAQEGCWPVVRHDQKNIGLCVRHYWTSLFGWDDYAKVRGRRKAHPATPPFRHLHQRAQACSSCDQGVRQRLRQPQGRV